MQRFLLPLLAVTALACAPQSEPKAPAASAKPGAQMGAQVTTTAADVAPKTNAIATLVVEAKKCKFAEDGFDRTCDAFKSWQIADEAFADGKGDDALLGMLASTDAKDRYLAADRLITLSGTVLSAEHARDPAIVDKILAAATKENHPVVAKRLADVVAHLDLAGTKRLGPAVEVAKTHRLEEYRHEFASIAGFLSHSRGEELLAWGEELSSDGHHDLGRFVMLRHTRDTALAPRACKDLSTLRHDASLGGSVMMDLAATPACRSFHDGIVKDIASIDLGKTKGPAARNAPAIALQSICSNPDTTPALKTKALVQAKRFTDSKNVPVAVRTSALSAVTTCDAKTGAKYASKLAKEKDLGPTPKSSRAAKK